MTRQRTDRGVSEVVSYLLGVVIVGMLVSGLVVSANTYFESRDDRAVGSRLESEGQRLAGTIETVDRLVRRSDSDGEIGRRVDLPDSIGSRHYTVRLVNDSQARNGLYGCETSCLVLSAGDVTRRVRFRSVTAVDGGEVVGQRVYVVRDVNTSTIALRGVE